MAKEKIDNPGNIESASTPTFSAEVFADLAGLNHLDRSVIVRLYNDQVLTKAGWVALTNNQITINNPSF